MIMRLFVFSGVVLVTDKAHCVRIEKENCVDVNFMNSIKKKNNETNNIYSILFIL